MEERNFLSLFKNEKPIIGMLHLKGDSAESIFERFKKELNMYIEHGVDGVIVESYYGSYSNLEQALDYIHTTGISIPYGVNCLNLDTMGFYLAKKYNADFVQIDSVVGHVKARDEEGLEEYFKLMRSYYDGYLIGGVRFKYQPVLSEKSLEEDLKIAMRRCDGICVTQDRTGQETSIEKIKEFKDVIGEFPLIIAAGVTPDNVKSSFNFGDAAICGSFFKDNYKDEGELCSEHIDELIHSVNCIREGK